MIFTDEEVFAALNETAEDDYAIARAIEAAVLAKLADKLLDAERYAATKAMYYGEAESDAIARAAFDSRIDAAMLSSKVVKP